MDLVEKYIESVRVLLPLGQRDDISEELDGVLRGKLEEKAEELGRPLTRAEQEKVLNDYGHPAMVAARYLPQRTLIGPELYPFWWLGARAAVVIAVLMTLGKATAIIASTDSAARIFERLMSLWGGLFSFALLLIGAITVSLAVVERFNLKPFGEWKPNGGSDPFRRIGKGPSRMESGAAVLGGLIGVGFWAGLPWIADWGPVILGEEIMVPVSGLMQSGVILGPIWWPVLWGLILAGGLLSIGVNMLEFARPSDRAASALGRMLSALMGVVIMVVALTAQPLFDFTNDHGITRRLLERLEIEHWLQVGLTVALIGYALTAGWYSWRWFRERTIAGGRQSSGAVTG